MRDFTNLYDFLLYLAIVDKENIEDNYNANTSLLLYLIDWIKKK